MVYPVREHRLRESFGVSNGVYLFIGEDSLSKDIKLERIKQEFLPPVEKNFNLDVLYAKELDLLTLQEKILTLPLKSKKRIIVIKDAQRLGDNIKKFILDYVKHAPPSVILVLDISQKNYKDEFISHLCRYAQVCRFRESVQLDTFALAYPIETKRTDFALRLLSGLLKDGEKPERILGGLRYIWERDSISGIETRKRLKALLDCDIDIKTGRLRPDFALEKLVVRLCGDPKSFR